MESHEIVLSDRLARRSDSLTLREVLEIGLRRKRTFGTCFLVIFLGAVLAAILLPLHYESEMKILVHRERLDPLVTAQQTAAVEQNLPSLTEEDINQKSPFCAVKICWKTWLRLAVCRTRNGTPGS
jgi:hypothetical protein